MKRSFVALGLSFFALSCAAVAADDGDPYMWLEEVNGAKAVAWVKEQSQRTTAELEKVKEFKPIYDRTLQIMDSKDRIPFPEVRGGAIYNFWQDEAHPRGIWRRTTPASYRTGSPEWETIIDMDALDKAENAMWVWKGANCLPPEERLCLVEISKGGSDASVHREFDTRTKKFVEGGFTLPEAKSSVDWRDENTLWVGTDFGAGSLTSSGYSRIVKLWARGKPLSAAKTVFEGETGDVASAGRSFYTPEGRYDVVTRVPAFFRQQSYLMLGDRLVRIDVPEDSNLEGVFKDRIIFSLRTDWTVGGKTYPSGALLAIDIDAFLRGGRSFETLFEPSERTSLRNVSTTRDELILSVLDNVRSKLYEMRPGANGWTKTEVTLPGFGNMGISGADPFQSTYYLGYSDFVTPSSLFVADGGKTEKLKSLPEFFKTDGVKVDQYEATSKDGTKIPYFVVTPKGFKADGQAPTILHAYGGFEIPSLPSYSGVDGADWIERGGVHVLANIRGGGEFGPKWHQAAIKENHIKNFEDLIAVAEDLIARKITSTEHLGIQGGSQGGLLVSGAFTQRPDLFGAVVAAVPLADMRRFNKLLAGASWMAEYGNPDDPKDWAYIQTWSPYQNLKQGVTYPKVFFWTTTRDDRVHPAHARKMAAKMMGMGDSVYYFENIEGGHGAGAINQERAYTSALQYAYFWKMLR